MVGQNPLKKKEIFQKQMGHRSAHPGDGLLNFHGPPTAAACEKGMGGNMAGVRSKFSRNK
jgi:hypothetical protein